MYYIIAFFAQFRDKLLEKKTLKREKNMNHQNHSIEYKIKDFLPLIIIFSIIIIFTIAKAFITDIWALHSIMNDFMGSFFIIFGFFKVINLKKFAEAYATYDLIAKRSKVYAFIYPFIELTLGIGYLLRLYPTFINSFTFVLMLISAAGVAIELSKGKKIMCACLGTVFKIPMTYVTLFEDVLMALMALIMLLNG